MKLTTIAIALLFVPYAVAQSSLEQLVAVADASADADQPAVNFGSATIVTSGKTYVSSPTFRVWMTRGHYLFDLSSVAGRPLPQRARLRVYQEVSSAAGCLDVTAHRVMQSWSEATLTWQNKPAHDPAVEASRCVGDSFDLGWKDFDVTLLVQAWLLGSVPNHGLVIRDPSESAAGAARPMHATSREGANTARRPHLELSWGTLAFGTGCGPNRTVPTLDLEAGTPVLGGSYSLRTIDLGGRSTVVYLIGISNTSWNGLPLPFNFAPLGYPACDLLVSLEAQLSGGLADSRGRALLVIPIPAHAYLRGHYVYHQTLALDASSVLAMSNGFSVLTY